MNSSDLASLCLRSSDLRQPLHPQSTGGAALTAGPSALRAALHPTYSSWINQVERWLAELQRRCLERGVFCSLDELTRALEERINLWNEDARPFTWTRTPDQIIDRTCRYCSRISKPAH